MLGRYLKIGKEDESHHNLFIYKAGWPLWPRQSTLLEQPATTWKRWLALALMA